jgi:hypothetical protein
MFDEPAYGYMLIRLRPKATPKARLLELTSESSARRPAQKPSPHYRADSLLLGHLTNMGAFSQR